MATFDLTVKDDAARAAAHLTALIGEHITIAGPSGRTMRGRVHTITLWANPGGIALMLHIGGTNCTWEGTIDASIDPNPPEPKGALGEAIKAMRRPPRLTPCLGLVSHGPTPAPPGP